MWKDSGTLVTPTKEIEMKVRISFSVDIDPEAWILNYGCDPKDVREDVKSYVAYGVQDQLESIGVLSSQNDPS